MPPYLVKVEETVAYYISNITITVSIITYLGFPITIVTSVNTSVQYGKLTTQAREACYLALSTMDTLLGLEAPSDVKRNESHRPCAGGGRTLPGKNTHYTPDTKARLPASIYRI